MFAVAITFQAIILTILIPCGIVQQSLLYPNRTELTWQAIKDVLFFNYYRLFGFMQLEEISGISINFNSLLTSLICFDSFQVHAFRKSLLASQ
ncbi:unnamed protein product [Dibothriocephalus latus]|uniref:Uncharacterized protein n=1 Tax=Dibothriocephalus latus TaxID=60516 RepID=A0A3P6QFJ6_DIBLA|nr:unnamed protein product [Dibothriocephalus latus]